MLEGPTKQGSGFCTECAQISVSEKPVWEMSRVYDHSLLFLFFNFLILFQGIAN